MICCETGRSWDEAVKLIEEMMRAPNVDATDLKWIEAAARDRANEECSGLLEACETLAADSKPTSTASTASGGSDTGSGGASIPRLAVLARLKSEFDSLKAKSPSQDQRGLVTIEAVRASIKFPISDHPDVCDLTALTLQRSTVPVPVRCLILW